MVFEAFYLKKINHKNQAQVKYFNVLIANLYIGTYMRMCWILQIQSIQILFFVGKTIDLSIGILYCCYLKLEIMILILTEIIILIYFAILKLNFWSKIIFDLHLICNQGLQFSLEKLIFQPLNHLTIFPYPYDLFLDL